MQTVDDVNFGQRLVGAMPQFVPGFFERHRVRAGIAGLQPRERAEETAGDADVGRFKADVEVVVGAPAVALLALAVRQETKGEQVAACEQAAPILEGEPLTSVEAMGDVLQSGCRDAPVHHWMPIS